MEWLEKKEIMIIYIKKYRYVLLAVFAGLFLMLVPEKKEVNQKIQEISTEQPLSLQDSLEEILCQISGAGEVKVLLTEAAGARTIYQLDEDLSDNDIRRETVIVSNADRDEYGLVLQINPPVYQGAIIVCEGADDANVRFSIVMAVMSATGLKSDHITVLKLN